MIMRTALVDTSEPAYAQPSAVGLNNEGGSRAATMDVHVDAPGDKGTEADRC